MRRMSLPCLVVFIVLAHLRMEVYLEQTFVPIITEVVCVEVKTIIVEHTVIVHYILANFVNLVSVLANTDTLIKM